ncbi:EamA family transporter [Neisseriaceae bacterium B1]
MVWVVYGLAQKWLLPLFSSQQILLMIYTGCAIVLSPLISPAQLLNLDGAMLGFFLYCCANTFIGYGAYGEALNHLGTSKISVITTMLPIFTMIFALLGHALFPHTFAAVDMNALAYMGALVVVCGAILAVAGDKLLKR